jgi:Zn-dependent protease with chaperone function
LCIIFDFFHHEVIMAVFAMIIAIAARSIIASIYLSKIMRVEQESNLIFEIFLTVSFIFLNYVLSPWIAFITYTTIFIIVIYICREKIARILKSILKM